MRLYLRLSAPKKPVSFDYQHKLTGALHKWLGPNIEHDGLSLYSFGWLSGSKKVEGMLDFPNGAEWFISSMDGDFLRRNMNGIMRDPEINWGMRVEEIHFAHPPNFPELSETRFKLSGPVFFKRTVADGTEKHYTLEESETELFLTQNLQFKLQKSGIDPTDSAVRFDRSYANPKTKTVNFPKYTYRASYCPVIIRGTNEQLAAAWALGIGQSTGQGFGSLI